MSICNYLKHQLDVVRVIELRTYVGPGTQWSICDRIYTQREGEREREEIIFAEWQIDIY